MPRPARERASVATLPRSRRARLDEAPRPAWHPVPLTEAAILVGIVLLAVGFFSEDQTLTLALGFGLTALASGELAAREHLAGYRSHSALLAGLAAVVLGVALVLAGVPQIVVLGSGIAAGLGAFFVLRNAFKRASGGLGFRV